MTRPDRWARMLAPLVICAPMAAAAADLDHDAPPYDPYASRYSSPYDDPRYRDVYQHPAPPRHVERYRDSRPGAHYSGSYKDGYLRPMDAPPRFADAPLRYKEDYCIPRGEIRRHLIREGWSDFHNLELRTSIAFVRARSPSGRLFELKVDRCTGHVVRAEPLGPPPFAHDHRRYGRSYY